MGLIGVGEPGSSLAKLHDGVTRRLRCDGFENSLIKCVEEF